jgi:hypothetical protein
VMINSSIPVGDAQPLVPMKVSIFSAKKKNEKNEPKNFLEMARIYGPRAFLDGLCSFCPLLAPRCIYFHHNTSRGSFFSY